MKFVPSRRVGAVVLVTAVTGGSVVAGIATAATSLKIDAVNGKLAFTKKSAKAKSGKVTIRMANPSSFPHAIAIKGKGVNKKGRSSRRAAPPSSPPPSRRARTSSTAR
jgi:hypothetical protein